MSIKSTQLEKKAWYRFFKVVYIIAILSMLLTIIVVAWGSIPRRIVDVSNTSFACRDDKSGSGSVMFGDLKLTGLPSHHSINELSLFLNGSREQESAKIEQGIKSYCRSNFNSPNYEFWNKSTMTAIQDSSDPSFNIKYALSEKTTGNWKTVVSTLIIGFGITAITFGLISWIFVYVVTGEKIKY